MSMKRSAGIVGVILLVLDFLTGGILLDSLGHISESPDTGLLINDFICLIGLVLVRPMYEVGGLVLPSPTIFDVILSVSIYWILSYIITTHYNPDYFVGRVYLSILFIFIIWCSIKLTGIIMIFIAGDSCIEIANSTDNLFSTFFMMGSIGAGYYALKHVKRIR
jgi:membrane-associated HD superfamily phosphohydrolase